MYFKILKKIAGIVGFKLIEKNIIKNDRLIGSKSFLNTNYFLQKIFNNKIETLVQIGANDGVRFDELSYFIKSRAPKSILVEPIKFYFDQLSKNYFNYKNVFLENSAINQEGKTNYIYKVSNKFLNKYDEHVLGINSFDKKHLLKHGVKFKHITTENVNSISVKKLLEKYNITKLDLLYVDAEGYDGNIIIDFLETCTFDPIIIFEYIHINHEIFKTLLSKLNSKGYYYFKVDENLICFTENKKKLIL